jgi:hypothetical protein
VPARLRRTTSLTALLLLAATAAAQTRPTAQLPWMQRARGGKSTYYTIRTDLPPAEARELADHLDRMYVQYSQRMASLPKQVPEKLNVLIFSDRNEYQSTLWNRFNVDSAGTGGVFFSNQHGTALAFWTGGLSRSRVRHVLQHEGFHQFAWSRFRGNLPPWTNEGLAEFFGEAAMVGNRLVIGQSKPRVLEAVKDAIERGTFIPFREMLTMDSARWRVALQEGTAATQYHQAWSMVHFLVYAPDEKTGKPGKYVGAFETYLRKLNSGVAYEDAFVQAFGKDSNVIEAFEKRWKAYALEARPSAFVTALERIEFLAEGALELSRSGLVPGSLEQMKEQLQAIGFSQSLGVHGAETTLHAADENLYVIPMDDLAAERPIFVVEAPRLGTLVARRRLLEEKQRTPPSITTKHLRPRGLSIGWSRDRKSGVISYEIVVK